MNMEEVIKLVQKHSDGKRNSEAIGLVIAGSLVADAINRLAKAQERQAEIQEKQWELNLGMMKTVSPMMKNMGDLTQKMKDDLNKEDSWRDGPGGLPDGDDDDDGLLNLDD